MIVVSEAMPNEYNIIQDIAYRTWPHTYGSIITNQQLDYMLDLFYSTEALNNNAAAGHRFILARNNQIAVGFAAFELNYSGSRSHIHKIYVLPEAQGLGVGRELINNIELQSRKAHQSAISLNVNRKNPARLFYEKLGFKIIREVDIALEHGYLMEDYVMEKPLLIE